MKIILLNKNSFEVLTVDNVSNIAFTSTLIAVTAGGATVNYSRDTYKLQIIW